MAGLLRGLMSAAYDSFFSSGQPFQVKEIDSSKLSNLIVTSQQGKMRLYKNPKQYLGIFHAGKKSYCIYQVNTEREANELFSLFANNIELVVDACPSLFDTAGIQKISDILREKSQWHAGHVAAYLKLYDAIKLPALRSMLDVPSAIDKKYPIHVAIESGDSKTVQEIVLSGVPINFVDGFGDTVLHYAARVDDINIIKMLLAKDKSLVNCMNSAGETALHQACSSNMAEHCEELLRWGGNLSLTSSHRLPIHVAAGKGAEDCITTLCKWDKAQVNARDKKHNATPLHWVNTKECVHALTEGGADLEAKNAKGETPLQLLVRLGRMECVMTLLCNGASAENVNIEGRNALHSAVYHDNLIIVQTLIVFGSDVNQLDREGMSPRHIAATSGKPNSGKIVHLLHKVGADRCGDAGSNCSKACAAGGSYNGEEHVKNQVVASPNHDGDVTDKLLSAATQQVVQSAGNVKLSSSEAKKGIRLLCLDGGGIRGLVLIQLLIAIESMTGQPIRNCFDWIAGTSTGGILALALLHKKPVKYCRGLYFQLKDKVFVGSRPYGAKPLEKLMKREFGEHTRMSEIEKPRVLVTGVLCDRSPAELHFFRNFEPPGYDYDAHKKANAFCVPPRSTEQLVWKAGRCSGAAPTYFKQCENFLDGGLIANNPTLDAMAEIQSYNAGLVATGYASQVRPIAIVVSLGTGKAPITAVGEVDVSMPDNILSIPSAIFSLKAMVNLLVHQVTEADGREVVRAHAWCSSMNSPYFRFNPQLSADIDLDCTDTELLINMLWETQCYICQNKDKIRQLANLLTAP